MTNEKKDRISFSNTNRKNSPSQLDPLIEKQVQDRFIPPEVPDDPLKDFDPRPILDPAAADERVAEGPPAEPKKALRRRKKHRNVKKVRVLGRRNYRLLAAAAVVIVFFLWLFLRLAPVPFGAVIIDGNETMDFAAVYHSSGINSPINVVQLSPDTIRDKLSHDLRVADVKVGREFPATIHITLTERKPAAVIATMYGFATIDQNGVVIQLGQQIKGASVPILTGKKLETLLLGDQITNGAVKASITYLQNLSPQYLRRITEVNVGNPDKIIAYTNDGIPIYLGNGDNGAERARITEEMLQEISDQNMAVAYVDSDVRAPLVKSK
jgi:cell division protein FtsQ